jgi:nucleoside-diphosphate-sugar epimerase
MIFIIGGRGFLGSAFARVCERMGRPYEIVDVDNYAEYRGKHCELLINANGNSVKWLSHKEPMTDFDASVRSVRASLVDIDCKRYIHVSTCDVYPDCSLPETTDEAQSLEPGRQSPYGFHKYLAEQCVMHGAERWMIVRMGGFVGPGMKKNAIFDILHGEKLWLDPGSELQFLHTEDAARIVLALHDQHGLDREIVNVCGDGVVKLADAMRWAGRDVPVDGEAKQVRYEISIEKLKGLVDVPKTRETVRQFVAESKNRTEEKA